MKANKKVLQIIRKAAEFEADMKQKGWPPDCTGVMYQPQRPQTPSTVDGNKITNKL